MNSSVRVSSRGCRTVFGLAIWVLLSGGSLPQAATLPAGFTESAWGASMGAATTAMAFAPDGRLFVCQLNGSIRVIDASGTLLPAPFATLTVDNPVGTERGLLGVAFDPNFATNNYVYVYYTAPTPTIHNRVSRLTADTSMPANGNVAVAGSEFPILNLETLGATNHNGGALHFGPDSKLYVATGENLVTSNSQSLSNRLGKILRINSDGTIPSNNPTSFPGIAGSPTGVNRSIWAVGLRNPFTFAFQPGTTRMFINDVGSGSNGCCGTGAFEEVNDGFAGSNYGWALSEGPTSNPNFRSPIYWYDHDSGSAIAGGAFYNPALLQFPSSYVGKYFFGDYIKDFIRVLDTSNNTAMDFATGPGNAVDIRVGPDGALYYLRIGGQVMRVQATPSQALNISTRARVETGENVLIDGFIVSGSENKTVIVRAIGPSMSGVVGPLPDPVLELRGPGGVFIRSNDNWQDDPTQASQISGAGLAPTNTLESVLIETLAPGNYTAIVSGKNAGVGVGLAEIYDISSGLNSQLANLSGRSFVQTGAYVMIGGFIVGNNIGAARVIVRGIGPSLASQGVATPLANPTLELRDGNGALIRANDDWQDDATQATQISNSGLEPTNSLESAIFAALAPGPYTAILAGKDGGIGVGLVEVYKLP